MAERRSMWSVAVIAVASLIVALVVSVSPAGAVPGFFGAPTSLVATPGDGSASISFTAGSGSPNNYEYQLDSGSWTALSPADTTSPITIPGLTNGTSYSIKIRAVGVFVVGTASSAVSVTPEGAPLAPTSLVATPENGAASIAFTEGGDGGSAITNHEYQIGSGSWTALSPSDTTSPITVPGLTNGTTYAIKIRAVNTHGSGAASASAVSVTPRTTPSALTSLSARPGNGAAEVSFTAGADGGSAITGYEYQLGSGAWTAAASSTLVSPITITGLTNGTTYAIRIRAVNAAGSGAASDAVSVTPVVSDTFVWTDRGTSATHRLWNSITHGGGQFVAVGSPANVDRVGQLAMTSPDGITWTQHDTPESANWFSVAYGNGTYVAVAGYGATHQVMTSPDGITWTLRDAAAVSDWVSVTYGGGQFVAVARYLSGPAGGQPQVMTSPDGITWTARSSVAGTNNWASVTYGGGMYVAVANWSVFGLIPDNQIMSSPDGITWTARSAGVAGSYPSVTYGNGRFVAVSSAYTGDPEEDGQLVEKQVVTSTDGVNWTAATAPGTNDWRSVTYGNGVFVAVATYAFSGDQYVMSSADGVTWTLHDSPGSGWWYSVGYGDGVFVAGTFTEYDPSIITSVLSTTPSAPTSLLATPGDASASISFTAGDDGGAPITNYEVKVDDGAWTALAPTDASSPITVTGLTNGTTHSIKLRAVNAAGSGAASSAVSVTPRTVPSAPTITGVTAGDSTVSVAFTAGSDGGSSISNYEYELNGSGSWFAFSPEVTSSPVSIPVTNGVAYTVKLRAVNAAGSGTASDASASFTPHPATTTPDVPTSLVVTPGDGSLSIAFTAGDDGGSSITKYQYSIDGGLTWTDTDAGTSSPVTISGLARFAPYSVELRAVNTVGAGEASDAVLAVTAGPAPTLGSPSAVSPRRVLVTWSELVPPVGRVLSYRAFVFQIGTLTKVASCKAAATDRSCTVAKLSAGTTYDVRIRAFIGLGGGERRWSVLSSPPSQVTTLN